MTGIPDDSEPGLLTEGDHPRILSLIKFLSDEYVETFRSGKIRLGSAKSYRENYQGEQGERHDHGELLSEIHQPGKFTIEINGVPIGGVCGPFEFRRSLDHRTYLLCMSAITDRFLNAGSGVQILSSELLALAPQAVFVVDVAEFKRRLSVALGKEDRWVSHPESEERFSALVDYVDLAVYNGPVGPFRKAHAYAFQLEWRLAIVDGRNNIEVFPDHIFLDVGDITDITKTLSSKDLPDMKIQVTPAGEEQ